MRKRLLARRAGPLAGLATLAVAAVALVPAPASAAVKTCPSKSIKIAIETEPPRKLPIAVKAIRTEGGVPCATAYSMISAALEGKLPSGWKSSNAHFKAPEGMIPQLLKNGSKKIKYAVHGG